MHMSRPATLLHLLLGFRTSTSTATSPTRFAFAFAFPTQCPATNLLHTHLLQPSTTANTNTKRYSSTMSSQPQSQPQEPSPNPQLNEESKNEKPILALPDASTATPPDTTTLDVNGDGVKLDHLGPLVVNADGTLSRIANWAQMTEIEKRNTMRVLGKRNRERREALERKAAEQEQGLGQGQGQNQE